MAKEAAQGGLRQRLRYHLDGDHPPSSRNSIPSRTFTLHKDANKTFFLLKAAVLGLCGKALVAGGVTGVASVRSC